MKITTLEKKKRLYLLVLDDDERLYVTEDTIVRFMLSKGKDLDEETLAEVKEFAQFSYGKNLALYYLSFKLRTCREIRDYLIKHEIEEERIEAVIDHLCQDKWLDDRRYVQQTFEQNAHAGDKGFLALKQKLQQKGITTQLISEVACDYDFSEVADRVARKLYRQHEGKHSQKGLEMKIAQVMVTRGFSYEEARRAIAQLEIESDEEAELDLLYHEADKYHRKYSRRYEGYELKQRLVQALARKGFTFDKINQVLREIL